MHPEPALNISQLAERTGYSRALIARQIKHLLIDGRILWSEYVRWRMEQQSTPRLAPAPTASLSPEGTDQWQAIERKFHGLDERNAQLASCNAPWECQRDSTELPP